MDRLFKDIPVAKDHHIRVVELAAVKLLRSIGWVFVHGSPGKEAPKLIRPRTLDHLGGC